MYGRCRPSSPSCHAILAPARLCSPPVHRRARRHQIALRSPGRALGKHFATSRFKPTAISPTNPASLPVCMRPPSKATSPRSDALSLLLKGTHLRAVNINENTIQVLRAPLACLNRCADGHHHDAAATMPPRLRRRFTRSSRNRHRSQRSTNCRRQTPNDSRQGPRRNRRHRHQHQRHRQ